MQDETIKNIKNEFEVAVKEATKTGVTEGLRELATQDKGIKGFSRKFGMEMKGAMGEVMNGAAFGGRGGGAGRTAGAAGITSGLNDITGLAGIWGGVKGGGAMGVLSAMSDSAGIVQGGLLGKLFGAASGIMNGPIGAAISLFSMFSKKKNDAPMSGVEPIFGGTKTINGGFDSLFDSNVFQDAVFSSRNADNEMFRKFADIRTAPEVVVHIKPSREFDAISEDRWVKTSKLNEMAGIPRRTNFNHG